MKFYDFKFYEAKILKIVSVSIQSCDFLVRKVKSANVFTNNLCPQMPQDNHNWWKSWIPEYLQNNNPFNISFQSNILTQICCKSTGFFNGISPEDPRCIMVDPYTTRPSIAVFHIQTSIFRMLFKAKWKDVNSKQCRIQGDLYSVVKVTENVFDLCDHHQVNQCGVFTLCLWNVKLLSMSDLQVDQARKVTTRTALVA